MKCSLPLPTVQNETKSVFFLYKDPSSNGSLVSSNLSNFFLFSNSAPFPFLSSWLVLLFRSLWQSARLQRSSHLWYALA